MSYDYKCPRCGYTKPVSQPVGSEPVIVRCTECWAADPKHPPIMERMISSSPTVTFKGPGFYTTDK